VVPAARISPRGITSALMAVMRRGARHLEMTSGGQPHEREVMRLEHWEFVNPRTLDKIFVNGFPGIALETCSGH
jgi:hypothetical protein